MPGYRPRSNSVVLPFVVLALAAGSAAGQTPPEPPPETPPTQASSIQAPAETPPAQIPAVGGDPGLVGAPIDTPPRRGPVDAARVEAFLDGLIEAQLAHHDLAGATVSVVRDGRILVAKGYGWHDVENRVPVDPATSLFRIGSISKTFTWTAIMQLVEAGQIALDDDINQYLEEDLRVPDTYDEPIRIRHLLTHTPGFEDQVIGLFGRDADTLLPLGEILRREMPARVRPPGTVASYSNHGTGIAGYIVEQVSGMSWDDYVEERILEPLGMAHTTFRQPLPAALAADMSLGYRWSASRGFVEEPFEFVPLAPVGSASATATDMARWMLAHLGEGELDGRRILRPATARQMQAELFRHAPRVNASAHGFYEMNLNGERVIGHGGDTLWFHSEMALVPEHGTGFFFSFNSAAGGAAKGLVYQQFMDEFFPAADPDRLTAPSDFASRAERYLGHYRPNRYSHRTLTKLSAIGAVEITLASEGELMTSSSGPTRFIEVEPLVFRARDEDRWLVFRENGDGAITHAFLGAVPIVAFEKVGFWGTPSTQGLLAAFSLLVLGGAVVLWPLAAFIRRRHRYEIASYRRFPVLYKVVAWVAAALLLAFLVGLVVVLSDPDQVVFGASSGLTAVLTLPLLALPLVAAVFWYSAVVWRQAVGSIPVRIAYTLVATAFVSAYWLLAYWNLLGYRY